MADQPVVHIGENSPEYIAFRLMDRVLSREMESRQQTREIILDTYAECLAAAKGYRG
jgi:hypothetical protein